MFKTKPTKFANAEPPSFALKCAVFVPVYNYIRFIDSCLESIATQTYKNIELVVVDDGSTDGTKARLIFWQRAFLNRGVPFTLLTQSCRQGPAASKWAAIHYLRTRVSTTQPPDVFMIVDGDDKLAFDGAVERVVAEYAKTKCLFTYGSSRGLYSEQTRPIPNPVLDMDIRGDLGRKPNEFIFGHPRSCAFPLLRVFDEDDFKMDGVFLEKCTDCPFIFKCVEAAGVDRVSHIPDVLYVYELHRDQTTQSVSAEYRARAREQVHKLLPRCPRLVEDIHVVMCTYQRRTLPIMLENLAAQTVAPRIVLHVINNGVGDASFCTYVRDVLESKSPRPARVQLHVPPENLFGYARFLVAKQILAETNPLTYIPYIVCIDDDQVLKPTFIEQLWNAATPNACVSWYGAKFRRDVPAHALDYWKDRTLTSRDIRACLKPEIVDLDYCGTGGAIYDSTLFRHRELFLCPGWMRRMEDLWASFVIRCVLGGRCMRLVTDAIAEVLDAELALHKTLHQDKIRMLRTLVSKGGFFLDSRSPRPEEPGPGFVRVKDQTNPFLFQSKDDSNVLVCSFTHSAILEIL